MTPRGYTIRPPSNPVLQVLYFVVGGVLLVGAVIIGAFVLAFVLGFAVIAGLIVYARVWWLSRKLGKGRGSSGPGSGPGPGQGQSRGSKTEALEVEYTVVSERDERSD